MSLSLETVVNNQELLWAVKMFIIIFIALLVSFFAERLLSYFHKKLITNKTIWDDLLIASAGKPIKVLIWIFGIVLALKVTGENINADLSFVINLLKNLGIIFCISWFIFRVVKRYENHLLKFQRVKIGSKDIDITTISAITKLIKAAIFITAILMILQTLGVNIGGILALGGVGGIVVGFAAKDLLANFFGSLTVYLDRPFVVGDHICSPDRKIEGTVEYIGWRLTHIRTFEKQMLYIPNSIFSNIIIENLSRMTNRIINESIGVEYKDINKIDKMLFQIKEFLTSHKAIDQSQRQSSV